MSEARRQAKHNLCSLSCVRLEKNAAKLPKTKIMIDGLETEEMKSHRLQTSSHSTQIIRVSKLFLSNGKTQQKYHHCFIACEDCRHGEDIKILKKYKLMVCPSVIQKICKR